MSQFIVGLTGGIGCGKTTVSDEFAKLGICVVDADVVARQMVAPGSTCLQAISEKFGPHILLADGNLNRAKLREAIFADPADKQWLDNLMHPAIRQQMQDELSNAASDYAILSAPLLFENGLDKMADVCLVIDIPEQLQIERTSKRDDVSTEQVKNIIKVQIDRDSRRQRADFIIENDQPWPQVQPQIVPLHQKFIHLAVEFIHPAVNSTKKKT